MQKDRLNGIINERKMTIDELNKELNEILEKYKKGIAILPKRETLIYLIDNFINLIKRESIELRINSKHINIIVVGDIHGNLKSLLKLLKLNYEKPCKFLFLGDYIERGKYSIEVLVLLMLLKLKRPERFYLLRGNHEDILLNYHFGFIQECEIKYPQLIKGKKTFEQLMKENTDDSMEIEILNDIFGKENENDNSNSDDDSYDEDDIWNDKNKSDLIIRTLNNPDFEHYNEIYCKFNQMFDYLSISCIINDEIFCVHGGIPSNYNKYKNEITYSKPYKIKDIFVDLVWSDPFNDLIYKDNYYSENNERGVSYLFGEKAIKEFLQITKFKLIIRGHQFFEKGYHSSPDNKVITIFSSINYADYFTNIGTIVFITKMLNKNEQLQYQVLIKNMEESNESEYKFTNSF